MWNPFWPSNSGPAIYLHWGAEGVMGVCPPSLHVLCTWRRPCPHWEPCGEYHGSMYCFYGPSRPLTTKVRAVSLSSAQSQTESRWVLNSTKVASYHFGDFRFSKIVGFQVTNISTNIKVAELSLRDRSRSSDMWKK